MPAEWILYMDWGGDCGVRERHSFATETERAAYLQGAEDGHAGELHPPADPAQRIAYFKAAAEAEYWSSHEYSLDTPPPPVVPDGPSIDDYEPIEDEHGEVILDYRHPLVQAAPIERVWTIIEGDGHYLWAVAGLHTVNYVGRIVTSHPWETGDEQFVWA